MNFSSIKILLVIGFCMSCAFISQSQFEKKNLDAVEILEAPKIDGDLSDACWKDVPLASGFIMDTPLPGVQLHQNTEVKFLYDHQAMYIGITCFDSAPDSIFSQLSGRDVSGNTDYCGVTFSCYRDGINGFTFIASARGEQYDARIDGNGEDVSWNAVWYCETRITDVGWVAEFKIPFAAIRFPDKMEQLWNVNFVREVRRNRHHAFWNGVNPMVQGVLTQMGTLSGIRNVKPPRRIFFYPYTSTYYNTAPNQQGAVNGSFSYNGGMDLKLGLSDAFTLDATLIPDFGQTISDQQVLNLTAFELQFADNRQFFTEGTELFSRGGIFYSRRIGFDNPIRYSSAASSLAVNEKLIDNPTSDYVVNAIKISGRDKHNLGIGFFNAVTSGTMANARDTITGIERSIGTSALTNYNVFVLDQILPHNSYFSLINTSVYRSGSDYDVNVIGTEFEIRDKGNGYSISGSGAMNSKYGRNFSGPDVQNDNGFRQNFKLNKISGNWRWNLGESMMSNTYDPKDLGFLTANNNVRYNFTQSYNIYQPFGRFNNFWANLAFNYDKLYRPDVFTGFTGSLNGGINTRKFNTYGYDFIVVPVNGYDYFEPRVGGRFFRTYKYTRYGLWYSSDYRKKIAIDASLFVGDYENQGRYSFNWRIAPRLRFNDHLFVTYVYSYQSHINDIGFAFKFEDEQRTKPLFGIRDVISHTNVLNVNYAFNPVMTLNTRVRHYWGFTKFHLFNSLRDDGFLGDTDLTADNQSFNSFTIDLVYTWIFRPGSQLSFVWKNAINNSSDAVPASLYDDISFVSSLPQNNSYSLKLIYFLDYRSITSRIMRDTGDKE